MKNVLLITTGNIARGGVQKYLFDWIVTTREKYPFQYVWYCSGKVLDIDLKRDFEELGVRIVPGNLCGNRWTKYFLFCKELKREMLRGQYDIVHINTGLLSYAFLALKIARKCKIQQIIVHSHNSYEENGRTIGRMLCNRLRRYIVKNASVCAGCSQKAAEWMYGDLNSIPNSWVYIKNKIDVVDYKFDLEIRKARRRELGLSDEILLGNVGRMNRQKNQFFLLNLMRKLKSHDKRFKLLLIGTGELKNELYEKAAEYKILDDVIFAGEKKNVNEWLWAMDFFLMPSLHEGLPIAGIEAQASGLSCLFTDNISREIKITNDVEFLPLQCHLWEKRLIEKSNDLDNRNREEFAVQVKESGYDRSAFLDDITKLYV